MAIPHPRFWGRRALPSLLIAALAFVAGHAWMQTLAERSPFLPPDFNKPSATEDAPVAQPASVQHLRFKGIFALNGTVKVNLFNTKTNKGTWVPVNGMIDGHRVVAYHSEKRAVDLEVDGKITSFDLMSPTDSPIPVASAPRRTIASRSPTRAGPITGAGGTSTVRRRTIVPPRPGTSSRTSAAQRTNRRTTTRPTPQSGRAIQRNTPNNQPARPGGNRR